MSVGCDLLRARSLCFYSHSGCARACAVWLEGEWGGQLHRYSASPRALYEAGGRFAAADLASSFISISVATYASCIELQCIGILGSRIQMGAQSHGQFPSTSEAGRFFYAALSVWVTIGLIGLPSRVRPGHTRSSLLG